MPTQNVLKRMYEGRFDDLTAMECIDLCIGSVSLPLNGIKPKDPVLKYVYEAANTVKLLNPTDEYYNSYDYRRELANALSRTNKFYAYEVERDIHPRLNERIRNQYNQVVADVKSYDSALLGYAPIVPYAGVMRKPAYTDITSEEARNRILTTVLRAKKKRTKEEALKNIRTTLECNPFNFMNGLGLSNDSDAISMNEIIISSSISTESACAIAEALVVEDSSRRFAVWAAESIFESMGLDIEELINVTNDSELESISAYEALQFDNSDKLKTLVDRADMLNTGSDNISGNFDLQALQDFITQHDHYNINELANDVFLKNNDRPITDISYYGEMVVVEIDDTYLATPVMDYSNGNTPVLLCIDRDGNISVVNI